jgi:spore coat protein H
MKRFLAFMLWTVVFVAIAAEAPLPKHVPLTKFVSNLPVVFLDPGESVASDRKVPCSVRLVLPDGSQQAQPLPGVVRFHGASSQAYPKKSYGITLNAPVNWLGLRESPHWVLNAAFIDRSLMRHKLAYDLFRSMATTNAPRYAAGSRFVEVIVHGKYQGVYLLMEKVDRAMLGLSSYRSNAVEHACIYKAVDHAATFDSLGHSGYEQREPDPLVREYWGPLDQLNRFVSSASTAEFFASVNGISARLNIDNAIDFHLLVLLTSNMDGFDKNLILARDAPRPNSPPPRFFFAPWDYDATFGRNWEGSRVGTTEWLSNHLFDRLLSNSTYRQQFASRWKELRQKPFSAETIFRLIDDNAKTLGAASDRNVARWHPADQYYPDDLAFSEDVAQMKRWVARRLQWLDSEIVRRTR